MAIISRVRLSKCKQKQKFQQPQTSTKCDRGNYRPVSLTSVCCKILEQLIRDHLTKYLLGSGLISDKQYERQDGTVALELEYR